MGEQIEKETFQSAVNTIFQVSDESIVALTLVRVQEGRSTDRIEQFSLIFHGPAQPLLTQGTRHLIHPTLGELDLFLVPIGTTSEGADYEAAFTRFLEKKQA